MISLTAATDLKLNNATCWKQRLQTKTLCCLGILQSEEHRLVGFNLQGTARLCWGNNRIVGNLAVQAGRLKRYVKNRIVIGEIIT